MQTSREMFAVIYGSEQFHQFLFGQGFVTEFDHEPLESIHLKHLSSAPPRLWRMLLQPQPYNLTIKYTRGQDVMLANALSVIS